MRSTAWPPSAATPRRRAAQLEGFAGDCEMPVLPNVVLWSLFACDPETLQVETSLLGSYSGGGFLDA